MHGELGLEGAEHHLFGVEDHLQDLDDAPQVGALLGVFVVSGRGLLGVSFRAAGAPSRALGQQAQLVQAVVEADGLQLGVVDFFVDGAQAEAAAVDVQHVQHVVAVLHPKLLEHEHGLLLEAERPPVLAELPALAQLVQLRECAGLIQVPQAPVDLRLPLASRAAVVGQLGGGAPLHA